MKELEGVGVAMITPFKENKEVDYEGLEKLCLHLIEGGADYLVVQGTTGESATLNSDEKKEVLARVKDVNQGKLPLVLGIGGNNTSAVIEQFRSADLNGVTAILSASPYYNKPSQEGIYQHYMHLAENAEIPIILYNVPGRTASNVAARTTLRLANDSEKIIGIKEASADMDQLMSIIKSKPDDFMVISGEDGLTFPIIACGGVGVISVVANAFPGRFSKMVKAAREKDLDEARRIHYQLYDFINLLFADGNPGGIKAALQALEICEDHLRLPLVPVNSELKDSISETVKSLSM